MRMLNAYHDETACVIPVVEDLTSEQVLGEVSTFYAT